MESSTTNRGKPGLLYEGFRYRKQKDTKETRLWRCVKKACNARCKTDLDETMILGGRFEHSHAEEDDRTLERQVLRQTCKKKATEEPCEKPYKPIISWLTTIHVYFSLIKYMYCLAMPLIKI